MGFRVRNVAEQCSPRWHSGKCSLGPAASAAFYEKTGVHEPAANMKLRFFALEGQGLDAGRFPPFVSPRPKLTTIKLCLHREERRRTALFLVLNEMPYLSLFAFQTHPATEPVVSITIRKAPRMQMIRGARFDCGLRKGISRSCNRSWLLRSWNRSGS